MRSHDLGARDQAFAESFQSKLTRAIYLRGIEHGKVEPCRQCRLGASQIDARSPLKRLDSNAWKEQLERRRNI
jgi:hypothetical protein